MTSARWLSFEWGPEVQTFAVDGERFTHPVATNTSPSHDVAHLIVAASGLPWRPSGPHENVCFAEYNSVLVEHLASTAATHLWYPGRVSRSEVLDRVLHHVRWFCEVHYAPFPVEADEALARCGGLASLEHPDRQGVRVLEPLVVLRERLEGRVELGALRFGPGAPGPDR